MLSVSLDYLRPVFCVSNVTRVSVFSILSVLFVFVLCLVCPMLPGSLPLKKTNIYNNT
jgi:hypothetical protein